MLGMVKKSGRKHSNECQFYITVSPLKAFDHQFVAFGIVVQGYKSIKDIEEAGTYLQRPIEKIRIVKCGIYKI